MFLVQKRKKMKVENCFTLEMTIIFFDIQMHIFPEVEKTLVLNSPNK